MREDKLIHSFYLIDQLNIESFFVLLAKAGYNLFPSYLQYKGRSLAIYGASNAIIISIKSKYKLTKAILSFLN